MNRTGADGAGRGGARFGRSGAGRGSLPVGRVVRCAAAAACAAALVAGPGLGSVRDALAAATDRTPVGDVRR
ncbi:hypothetical protein AB0J21_04765 [Streptomyces sp. NPDC049954]|uniref:hypothetical protein n=1 Tax=Streptomyces sp. NPDC049954 TaxID=3155779 RepID=UPI003423779F